MVRVKDKQNAFLDDIVHSSMRAYLAGIGFNQLNKASDKHKGEAFLDFYVKDIAIPLHHLDADAAEEGLKCDGRDDMGMDFICKHDDVFHVVQSKYKRYGNVSEEDIARFFGIHETLTTGAYKTGTNDYVVDALREYKPSSPVKYWFVTTAKASDEARNSFDNKRNRASKKGEEHEWDLIDLPKLMEQHEEVSKGERPEEVVFDIPRIGELVLPGSGKFRPFIDLSETLGSDKYRTIVTAVKGTALKGIFQRHKSNLFHHNIRGFLGANRRINKKIKETLEKHPEYFYLYNNGISATCTGLEVKADKKGSMRLVCTKFQIINGAQTTTTVGKFRDDKKLADAWILLRITKAEDIGKQSKGLNRIAIMESNNSQTAIRFSDFRSNDPIQNFLAREFKQKTYKAETPYRPWHYMPKQGEKPKDDIALGLEQLAKCLYAYNSLYGYKDGNPAKLYSQSNFLYDTDERTGGVYWRLFGDEDGNELETYEAKRTQEIIAIASLWKYTASTLAKKRKELKSENKTDTLPYMAACLTWHHIWAFSFVLSELSESEQQHIHKKMVDGKAFEPKGFVDNVLTYITAIIQTVLQHATQHGEEKHGEKHSRTLNFKRWQRTEDNIEGLKGLLSIKAGDLPKI